MTLRTVSIAPCFSRPRLLLNNPPVERAVMYGFRDMAGQHFFRFPGAAVVRETLSILSCARALRPSLSFAVFKKHDVRLPGNRTVEGKVLLDI